MIKHSIALAMLGIMLSGCALESGLAAGSAPVTRDSLKALPQNATVEQVQSALGLPASERRPTRTEIHNMLPGTIWDQALVYDGKAEGRYLARSAQVFFHNNAMIAWSLPAVTVPEYTSMVDDINQRRVTQITELQRLWGWPADVTRGLGGTGALRYHVVHFDGAIYRNAITATHMGPQIMSLDLAQIR